MNQKRSFYMLARPTENSSNISVLKEEKYVEWYSNDIIINTICIKNKHQIVTIGVLLTIGPLDQDGFEAKEQFDINKMGTVLNSLLDQKQCLGSIIVVSLPLSLTNW